MRPLGRYTLPTRQALLNRRQWLAATCAMGLAGTPDGLAWAASLLPRPLAFPRDHGTHNDARTEWWYLTGYAYATDDRLFGFQVTFFRSRVDGTAALPGRLAARHLLFAHAAITDVQASRAVHDQRITRWNGAPPAGGRTSAAYALEDRMDVRIGNWSLRQDEKGERYEAGVRSGSFAMDLVATPSQPLLLQGDKGFSRKGPSPEEASFYTTHPQLTLQGSIEVDGRTLPIRRGLAWLDHEWSETLLPPDAVGWDWIGMNLDDGACLTAFQLRAPNGRAVWAGGSYRGTGGQVRNFAADEVSWTPRQWWTSPRTGARYPMEWDIATPAGLFRVKSLVSNQEIDSRQSTGTVYWEGLSTLSRIDGEQNSTAAAAKAGMGYLEMTGYAGQLRL